MTGIVMITFVEQVAVLELKDLEDYLSADWFSESEREDLQSRAVQSAAGFLALKRSLMKLCALQLSQSLCENQIILGHHPMGAPRIVFMPDACSVVLGNTLISISHNRIHAYGLAVFNEENVRKISI